MLPDSRTGAIRSLFERPTESVFRSRVAARCLSRRREACRAPPDESSRCTSLDQRRGIAAEHVDRIAEALDEARCPQRSVLRGIVAVSERGARKLKYVRDAR